MPARVVHLLKATGVAGAEKHLLTLLPALDRDRFETRMLVLTEPDLPVAEFLSAMQACHVPATRMRIFGDADPSLLPRLVQRLRRLRPTIVHTHLVHADLYGVLAARLAGVPIVISSRHNDDPFRVGGAVAWLIRQSSRFFDHFLAISEHLRQFAIQTEGAAPERVSSVHYGIDPTEPPSGIDLCAEFGIRPGPLVACVARLVPQKGHSVLLSAFREVVRSVPDAHLLLVGDGTMRRALEQLAAERGLRDHVTFAGWRADAAQLLFGADVFVLPSLWEGFGLVLLEAMSASLPIVASRVGAIPEVVSDGETGLLAEPGDEQGLANALIRLSQDPQLRARMGEAGRKRLETHFSVGRMVRGTEDVYEKVCARAGVSVPTAEPQPVRR